MDKCREKVRELKYISHQSFTIKLHNLHLCILSSYSYATISSGYEPLFPSNIWRTKILRKSKILPQERQNWTYQKEQEKFQQLEILDTKQHQKQQTALSIQFLC